MSRDRDTRDPSGETPTRGVVAGAVAVARTARRADATFVAGSLAYYSIVATLPVVVLAFAVLYEAGGGGLARGAVTAGGDLLTPRGREFLRGAMSDVARRRGIIAVAAGLVCFSVVQLFRGYDRAFAAVYGGDERRVLGRTGDAVFAFGVGALATLAMLLAAGALSLYANESIARVAVPAVVFLLSAVALFPLFYALPTAEVGRREVLPGTLIAACGWTVAGAGFGVYAADPAALGIYGALGGLLVLVTWFYAANVLVLVGAAANAVLAGRA
ncbi:YihY/virulence factor BrkB family protein [Halobaculum sp. CBA1158]|uniref:YihY/virulence factor BrkB family protein n=1 Tax=Halobaculum sp. CBA1158 TaxID=2904243 RepID=UPI001F33CB43|nr:YihY/virulence factor BrkB family protein [Halobaculum sp. CBA1158]UIP00170.1 YihY/virulence factor BrkB family protein [Halobaculum sp. CBA1158]